MVTFSGSDMNWVVAVNLDALLSQRHAIPSHGRGHVLPHATMLLSMKRCIPQGYQQDDQQINVLI